MSQNCCFPLGTGSITWIVWLWSFGPRLKSNNLIHWFIIRREIVPAGRNPPSVGVTGVVWSVPSIDRRRWPTSKRLDSDEYTTTVGCSGGHIRRISPISISHALTTVSTKDRSEYRPLSGSWERNLIIYCNVGVWLGASSYIINSQCRRELTQVGLNPAGALTREATH